MYKIPISPGVTVTKIVRVCACRTSKIWLSLYQFFAKFPTHQYTIFERKTPNFDQIGCFLQEFAQNTPNLIIWAPSSLIKKNPDRYTKYHEKVPQKAGT